MQCLAILKAAMSHHFLVAVVLSASACCLLVKEAEARGRSFNRRPSNERSQSGSGASGSGSGASGSGSALGDLTVVLAALEQMFKEAEDFNYLLNLDPSHERAKNQTEQAKELAIFLAHLDSTVNKLNTFVHNNPSLASIPTLKNSSEKLEDIKQRYHVDTWLHL